MSFLLGIFGSVYIIVFVLSKLQRHTGGGMGRCILFGSVVLCVLCFIFCTDFRECQSGTTLKVMEKTTRVFPRLQKSGIFDIQNKD
jgi:hypothetical protein